MEDRILFLTDKESHISVDLLRALRENEFSVTTAELNKSALQEITDFPQGIFLLLQESHLKRPYLANMLMDQLDEQPALLFIAYLEPEVLDRFHKQYVSATFPLPLKMSEVAARIHNQYDVKPRNKVQEYAALLAESIHDQSLIPPKRSQQILLVDDDSEALHQLKTKLQREYHVFLVSSGMAAIWYLANHQIDLVLMDYAMPILSGPATLERLREKERSRDLPVFFLTDGSEERTPIGPALRPEGYLLKSASTEDLVQAIEQALGDA